MKLSLSSFIYINYPLEEAIRRTAAQGFHALDIWGGRPHAYRKDLSDREIGHVCRLLQDEGLSVASFIPAQFRYPTSLCSPNELIRRDSMRYIQDGIETARALGAPLVSVCPGHTLFGQTVDDGLGRLSDSLCAITEFAARFAMRVALEPADKYETDLVPTGGAALELVKTLGYENLGVLLDTGHEHVVGESAVQAARVLGDRLFHVHIDDNHGARDEHLVPGEGSFCFRPFLDVLQEVAYSGFLAAELSWDYSLDPDRAAALTIKRMQAFLA